MVAAAIHGEPSPRAALTGADRARRRGASTGPEIATVRGENAGMAVTSGEPADPADLGLVQVLAEHARAEVADLSVWLGVPPRRIRERIRTLQRSGVIRGLHAITAEPSDPGVQALVMLRFQGGHRLGAAELCALAGVHRVYALCATWDFMVEYRPGGVAGLLVQEGDRGMVRILGVAAEFEVLHVRRHRAQARVEVPLGSDVPTAPGACRSRCSCASGRGAACHPIEGEMRV